MKEKLTIALLQLDLFWEDATANLSEIEEKLWSLEKDVDVIVLPEMFTSGFSMNVSTTAEMMNGHSHRWMKQISSQFNALVVGSLPIKEKGNFYNRLLAVKPSGETIYYDKKHLFNIGLEGDGFTAGDRRLIVEWRGWRICPLICYDLRFPTWSRNNKENPYDALIYVANWPEQRDLHWRTLLQARAIENASYVIGVNRTGRSPHEGYAGSSSVFSYAGEEKLFLSNEVSLSVLELDKSKQNKYRLDFPVLEDQD